MPVRSTDKAGRILGRNVHAIRVVERATYPVSVKKLAPTNSGPAPMIRTAAGLIDLMFPSLSNDDDAFDHRRHDGLEMLLRTAQRGQIAADQDEPVVHRGGGQPHLERVSRGRAVGGMHDATGSDDRRRIHLGTDQLADRTSHRVGLRPAVDGLGRRIPMGDHPGHRSCR